MKCEILPIAALFVDLDNLNRVGDPPAETKRLSALKRLASIAPGIEEHANLIFYISGHLRPEMYFFKTSGLVKFQVDGGYLLSGSYVSWLKYCRLRPLSPVTKQLHSSIKQYENRNG